MDINQYGQVIVTEQEAMDTLYNGNLRFLSDLYIDNDSIIEQFNRARQINRDSFDPLIKLTESTISVEEFDKLNQQQWFMPEKYQNYNIVDWLYSECKTDEQKERVSKELKLFVQHNIIDLLKYIKYLVDTMRENNIVWGVGRGSSVASYVLYLIGIHKIDSIKYELDIQEFLR